MRLIGTRRRRSRGWWAVFVCACLAMGAYMAFDVLDLDGSNLRNPGPGSAIAAEPGPAEGERLLPQRLATLEAQGLAILPLKLRLTAEPPPPVPCAPLDAAVARRAPNHSRARLHRETSAATPPIGDPA